MKGLTADWLLVGDGSSIRGGAVIVDSLNTVIAVGDRATLGARYADIEWHDFPGILFPALLNMHTHLELSALRAKVGEGLGFSRWANEMMAARFAASADNDEAAIQSGVGELKRYGTAFVVDICNSGNSIPLLNRAGVLSHVMLEVFAMDEKKGAAHFETLKALKRPTHNQRVSVVPHSLYGTPRSVLKDILAYAERDELLSLHFAEHEPERQWLKDQGGALGEFFASLKLTISDGPVGQDPLSYAKALEVMKFNILLIHNTNLRSKEISELGRYSPKLVLCPRSNLYIESELPLLDAILAQGIKPSLGTDSLASNHSLDVLAEAHCFHQSFPHVAKGEIFAMACANAADQAGLNHVLGRLRRGLKPGVLFLPHQNRSIEDPHAFLFDHHEEERQWIIPPSASLESAGVQ